jgi:hypothetical protein
MKRIVATIVLGLVLVACGGNGPSALGPGPSGSPSAVSSPTPPGPSPSSSTPSPVKLLTFEVWFVRGGKLFETTRTAPYTVAVARLALDALLQGPKAEEAAAEVGTDLPNFPSNGVDEVLQITALSGGVATVEATPPLFNDFLPPIAQVVYTLTQYPTIRSVKFVGDRSTYTRASLEDQLPPIVVESPFIGQTITSPVTISGTADVFEAVVNMRILDAFGRELGRTFTMASCGTGCRGDYSVSVPFTVTTEQPGTVEVYEVSAKDGSAINVGDFPVILAP